MNFFNYGSGIVCDLLGVKEFCVGIVLVLGGRGFSI